MRGIWIGPVGYFINRNGLVSRSARIVMDTTLKIFEIIRALFLTLVTAVAVFAVGFVIWKAVPVDNNKQYHFGIIDLPEALAKRGYSATVVAQRIFDHVTIIQQKARTKKKREQIIPEGDALGIELPGTGISLDAFLDQLRAFLGVQERRISGDLTCPLSDCAKGHYSLQMRIEGPRGVVPLRVQTAPDVDQVIRLAAEEILFAIDPYILASYYYTIDPLQALPLIHHVRNHEPVGDDSFVYNLWGNVLFSQGHYKAAASRYERALELAETADSSEIKRLKATSFTNWGNSLNALGDFETAVKMFEAAAALDTKNAVNYYNWGLVLYQNDNLDGALQKYDKATELEPKHVKAHHNAALILYRQDRLADASARFLTVIKLDPDHHKAHYGLGVVHYVRKNNIDAAEEFRIVTELAPNFALAYLYWGDVLYRQDKTEEAIEKWRRFMKLAPNSPRVPELTERIASIGAG